MRAVARARKMRAVTGIRDVLMMVTIETIEQPHRWIPPTRRYDFGDAEDVAMLARQRKGMVTRTRRTVAEIFAYLSFGCRIGGRELRRLCGPGLDVPRPQLHIRQANLRHDVALGLVGLHDAIAAGEVGEWKLRLDGARWKLKLDDVPDMQFNISTDWREVIDSVVLRGWSYTDFAELAGTDKSQISRLSRGKASPRMALGESVLWGARFVRDDRVIPRKRDSMALRQPASRIFGIVEGARPWWLSDPIIAGSSS